MRCFALTGKDTDARMALAADSRLDAALRKAGAAVALRAEAEATAELGQQFLLFRNKVAELLLAHRDIAANTAEIASATRSMRTQNDDLLANAAIAGAAPVEFGARQVSKQFAEVSALATAFVAKPHSAVSAMIKSRQTELDGSLAMLVTDKEDIHRQVKDVGSLLASYSASFAVLTEKSRLVLDLVEAAGKLAELITLHAQTLKLSLQSRQSEIEAATGSIVAQIKLLVALLGIGGLCLGIALAWGLGRGIARPMTLMCLATRELAAGKQDLVLPGLGRKDEVGEMAAAVEAFKKQSIVKAATDA